VIQEGWDKTKFFEGLSLTPYKDVAGWWTIGVGHKTPGPTGAISLETAMSLYKADYMRAEAHALALCPRLGAFPRRLAALTDLVFNVGFGAVAGQGVIQQLNVAAWQEAADRFKRWNHVRLPPSEAWPHGQLVENAGLTKRRIWGAQLIVEG